MKSKRQVAEKKLQDKRSRRYTIGLKSSRWADLTSIIDNAAEAVIAADERVEIDHLGAQKKFSFIDDGLGMTCDELVRAMRPRSAQPGGKRNG